MSFLSQFGGEEVRTVGEYTRQIKVLLERQVPPCWVKGEISNFRRQASGHLYFSLKDEEAQLPAVMFRGDASGLGFALSNGQEVLAYGEISVYEPHGRYQLIVRAMMESGMGRLHQEFERLKRKLQGEGLFEEGRKRPLPALPLRVGFVTSASGAAAQDFIRILKRRGWPGRLSIIPSPVQGRGAGQQIASAIELADRMGCFDVLVVGRGGGSLEDLWCFNEEVVARAVARCGTPILSAVGHEIDFTLCDFAADLRAETPSAAAELISSSCIEQIERLERARRGIEDAVSVFLSWWAEARRSWAARLKSVSPTALLERSYLRLDDLGNRLRASLRGELGECVKRLREAASGLRLARPDVVVREKGNALRVAGQALHRAVEADLLAARVRYEKAAAALRSLGPEETLKRGYALLSRLDGRPIGRIGDIPDEAFEARLRDGSVRVKREG